jgi:hypothetical protein
LGARLHWLKEMSLRHYLAAWELKRAGLDWRQLLLSRCLSGRALLVAQLQADPRYSSEAERVAAFQAAGGGCRATYFNWARQLQGPRSVPDCPLGQARPEAGRSDADRLLRRRR